MKIYNREGGKEWGCGVRQSKRGVSERGGREVEEQGPTAPLDGSGLKLCSSGRASAATGEAARDRDAAKGERRNGRIT